ncbi:restriction endonuclease subunit S [Microbacterium sp. OR21]|uniref:restriction endonuclease subunit S n=1 Tax=Microbacterium sp. OR21 TaxID=3095346 RepID=UPI0039B3C57C
MSAPWLGELPPGWQEIALRYLARVETGSRDTVDAVPGGEYPFIIRSQKPLEIDSFSYDTEAVLTAGDGAVGEIFHHVDGRFEVHQRVYVMHDFRGLHGRFFFYYFSSQFGQTVAYGGAQSTVASLRRPMFTGFPVAVPPLKEQRAIADYLDRETAQIDAFIAKNEELIALLAERRAAVIAGAVTRGLSESVELKDSGVKALGSVPVNWKVARIRDVGRAIIGLTYSPEEICGEDDGGTLVLRAGNIQNGELAFEDCVYVTKPIPYALKLQEGDIVICARNGSARLIGKNAIATGEVVGQTWGAFMAVLRTPMNEYLRWVLNSTIFTASLGAFSTSTINQLTSSTLHSLRFAMPPMDEQAAISGYLTEATAATNAAIRAAERAVDLARERRAALISAAVTGKIDVGVAT